MNTWKTFRLDAHPEYAALPREFCTLTMISGPSPGSVQPVGQAQLVLGRDPSLPACIDDRGMSRHHAKVFQVAGVFFVEDLGSTNGTRVNGDPLERARKLSDGDRIQLGENTVLRVALLDADEHAAQQKLFDAAIRDPLTGVFNRGYFQERLDSEFAFAVRHKVPLSVLLVDLDHFKQINDTHGHQTGDDVLCSVCKVIGSAVRREDVFARYGGEEFVVLARGIGDEGARQFGERIRRLVENVSIQSRDGAPVPVTASIGYASTVAERGYTNASTLVAEADRALYKAKESGRNRVCSSPP